MAVEVEYNNGFLTALMLFYAHRYWPRVEYGPVEYDFRIHGGSDHLLDIQIPESLDDDLKSRVRAFVGKVLSLRYADMSRDEADKIFNECLEIMKELDRWLFSLEVVVEWP
jgi:hypothetical protein